MAPAIQYSPSVLPQASTHSYLLSAAPWKPLQVNCFFHRSTRTGKEKLHVSSTKLRNAKYIRLEQYLHYLPDVIFDIYNSTSEH